MTPFAQNDAFEWHFHLRQGLQQHIHSLSADQLAREEQEVTVAEGAADARITVLRDGRQHRNSSGLKTIPQQLVSHILSRYDQPVAFLIQPDFFSLCEITHPFEWKPTLAISRQERAATEDAVGRGSTAANLACKKIIFV